MRKVLLVAICPDVFASLAVTQRKLESKWNCSKSAAEHKLHIGDTADHVYAISQGTCNTTSSTADTLYYTYEGGGDLAKKTASNKLLIVSSTDKHKGTRGSGTCSGTFSDDGSSDRRCAVSIMTGK